MYGDKIDGDDPSNCCVWEDIGVYLYINILHLIIETYEVHVVNWNCKWLQCSNYTCTSHIASSITT